MVSFPAGTSNYLSFLGRAETGYRGLRRFIFTGYQGGKAAGALTLNMLM